MRRALLAALAALSIVPAAAEAQVPTTWTRSADFTTNLTAGTDGWNLTQSGFSVSRSSEKSGWAAKIVNNGGNSGCGCPRMKFEDGFRYGSGREVWMRGSFLLPTPTGISWSRLMNFSSYFDGSSNNHLTGLVIEEAGYMKVIATRYGGSSRILIPRRAVPVNRWFTVALRLRLSTTNGSALTEMYVNGTRVASSTTANMVTSQAFNVYQGGAPYFLNGLRGQVIYFDNPAILG